MFDLESLMQQQVEPKDLRKRPKGFQKWLSYLWPQRVLSKPSNYTGNLLLLAWRGKYMLDTERVNYSFGSLHTIMEKTLAELKVKHALFDRVLMLGYGGGSAAEIIHQHYQREAAIVGIEIDPVVIELAKSYFYSKGVRILQENAFDYLRKASENSWEYDVILVDLFIDDIVPEAVTQEDFIKQLALVAPEGAIAINTMKDALGQFSSANQLLPLVKEHFKSVSTMDVNAYNRVIFCSKF
ncbi:MAG: spermidine synthase [Bacteroidota bacterium]